MGLQQFEQRLERLVEGAFAKAFRGELQPVELGRRLAREMDLQRNIAVRGVVAPNSFDIDLAPDDFDRFGGFVDELARELLEAAREHARTEGYTFLGPVEVKIDRRDGLSKSTFDVRCSFVEGDEPYAGWLVLRDGRRVAVGDAAITIGRLPDCTIPIGDPNASRRHAQVLRDGVDVRLVDLNSTNGTRVNGLPVREHRMRAGDVITIGTTTIRYEAV